MNMHYNIINFTVAQHYYVFITMGMTSVYCSGVQHIAHGPHAAHDVACDSGKPGCGPSHCAQNVLIFCTKVAFVRW